MEHRFQPLPLLAHSSRMCPVAALKGTPSLYWQTVFGSQLGPIYMFTHPGSASAAKYDQRCDYTSLLLTQPLCTSLKARGPQTHRRHLLLTVEHYRNSAPLPASRNIVTGAFQSSENNLGYSGTWLPSPQRLLLGVLKGAMPLPCRGRKPAAATPCWGSRQPLLPTGGENAPVSKAGT